MTRARNPLTPPPTITGGMDGWAWPFDGTVYDARFFNPSLFVGQPEEGFLAQFPGAHYGRVAGSILADLGPTGQTTLASCVACGGRR